MYNGILCDVCGLRIPGATINALVKVTNEEAVHIAEVNDLEVCTICPIGPSPMNNGATVEIMRILDAKLHSNPLHPQEK